MARLIGLGSLLLILASLGSTGFVVLGNAAARAQVTALHFPVTALKEGILEMALPILLCALGTIGAILAVWRKIGRVALGAAVLNWAVLYLVIGVDGFKSLF